MDALSEREHTRNCHLPVSYTHLIEHDGKVAAGRVLHAGSHIKTAHGETVLLILDGTRADGDIGQQVFHRAPVPVSDTHLWQ